jgi:hypothetical protein
MYLILISILLFCDEYGTVLLPKLRKRLSERAMTQKILSIMMRLRFFYVLNYRIFKD